MTYYYPIPAGAAVTCYNCAALLRAHLDDHGFWRGCPARSGEEIPGAYAVFLVSTNRRRMERRRGTERRVSANGGGGGTMVLEVPPVVQQMPVLPAGRTMAAGPRAAVYLLVPGARLMGQGGQTAAVFRALEEAGGQGMTAAEIRKALKLKPKSLESVLHRMRLAGVIRGVDSREVRG